VDLSSRLTGIWKFVDLFSTLEFAPYFLVPLPPPVPKESLGAGYFPYARVSHFLASGRQLGFLHSTSLGSVFSRWYSYYPSW